MAWKTAAAQREYRDRQIALGNCAKCSRAARGGGTLCDFHRALEASRSRRRRQAKRPPSKPPVDHDAGMYWLLGHLIADMKAGRPWPETWNRRSRQLLARVPREERGYWRDLLRAAHFRNAVRDAYQGRGRPFPLDRSMV